MDHGYKKKGGEPKYCRHNSHDCDEVRQFKKDARARHEHFNGRLKNFGILDHKFRHKKTKFKQAFEAVCVICQNQMDTGSHLYDV